MAEEKLLEYSTSRCNDEGVPVDTACTLAAGRQWVHIYIICNCGSRACRRFTVAANLLGGYAGGYAGGFTGRLRR